MMPYEGSKMGKPPLKSIQGMHVANWTDGGADIHRCWNARYMWVGGAVGNNMQSEEWVAACGQLAGSRHHFIPGIISYHDSMHVTSSLWGASQTATHNQERSSVHGKHSYFFTAPSSSYSPFLLHWWGVTTQQLDCTAGLCVLKRTFRPATTFYRPHITTFLS